MTKLQIKQKRMIGQDIDDHDSDVLESDAERLSENSVSSSSDSLIDSDDEISKTLRCHNQIRLL